MCLKSEFPEAKFEAGIPVYMIDSGGAPRLNLDRSKSSWAGHREFTHECGFS